MSGSAHENEATEPEIGFGDDMDTTPPAEADGGVSSREAEGAEDQADTVIDGPSEPESELVVVTRERDEFLDSLRRLQADFENYRKRVAKQQSEQGDRASETLVRALLPVLDTVDLALAHLGLAPGVDIDSEVSATGGPEESTALAQISASLLDVLAKQGLERLVPQGMPFDPNEHEAVMHEAGEGEGQPEVVEVLRSGWRWKGRVLRAAMVKVKG